METVERALGDLRVSNGTGTGNSNYQQQPRGGRNRNNYHGGGGLNNNYGNHRAGPPVIPDTEFDFASSNSRFDKAAVAANVNGAVSPDSPEPGQVETKYYDKSRSFFDDISSDSKAKVPGQGPGRGGGRGGGRGRGQYNGGGRNRREDERNRNLSTFGEAGVTNGTGNGYWPGGGVGNGGGGGGGWRGRRRRPWNGGGRVSLS